VTGLPERDELPSFVHRLSSGTTLSDEPEWPPGVLDEINRRCDEIREARARAEVSSRGYIII
jgi:hypothetical protein